MEKLQAGTSKPKTWYREIDCVDATYYKYQNCYCKSNCKIEDCDNIEINSE